MVVMMRINREMKEEVAFEKGKQGGGGGKWKYARPEGGNEKKGQEKGRECGSC